MLRITTEENVGFVLFLAGSLSDQGSVCPVVFLIVRNQVVERDFLAQSGAVVLSNSLGILCHCLCHKSTDILIG